AGDESALHSEDAKTRIRNRRVERRRQAERQRLTRLDGIEDAVIPESRGGVVGRSFAVVFFEDGIADRLLVFGRQRLAFTRGLIALARGGAPRRLIATHDRDARVGPHPQETRLVGAAAHAVVAGTKRSAD